MWSDRSTGRDGVHCASGLVQAMAWIGSSNRLSLRMSAPNGPLGDRRLTRGRAMPSAGLDDQAGGFVAEPLLLTRLSQVYDLLAQVLFPPCIRRLASLEPCVHLARAQYGLCNDRAAQRTPCGVILWSEDRGCSPRIVPPRS